jgi:hypothetical protein
LREQPIGKWNVSSKPHQLKRKMMRGFRIEAKEKRAKDSVH